MTTPPIPDHARAVWDGNTVTNKGDVPLWSGKGDVPAIGDVVPVSRFLSATVEGYSVDAGWLMLDCTRSDGARGNLSGAEIAWQLVGKVVQPGEPCRVDLGRGMVGATFVRARQRHRNGGAAIHVETVYVVKVKGKERTVARANITGAL